MELKIHVSKKVKAPTRGTTASAGLDFYIPHDFKHCFLYPGESARIPSGIKMVIPDGKVGTFWNRSSHGSKGLLAGAQVIDSDYRGEVHIDVHYVGNHFFELKPGMKIIQLLIQDVYITIPKEVNTEEFSTYKLTERAEGGFGSTGE